MRRGRSNPFGPTMKTLTCYCVACFYQAIANKLATALSYKNLYSLEKASIPVVEPDSLSGKAIPSIAYYLSKTKKLAATLSLAIGTTLMDKDIAPGSNILKEALGVISKNPKSDLIIIIYFSQLRHQDPWEVEPNTRGTPY